MNISRTGARCRSALVRFCTQLSRAPLLLMIDCVEGSEGGRDRKLPGVDGSSGPGEIDALSLWSLSQEARTFGLQPRAGANGDRPGDEELRSSKECLGACGLISSPRRLVAVIRATRNSSRSFRIMSSCHHGSALEPLALFFPLLSVDLCSTLHALESFIDDPP